MLTSNPYLASEGERRGGTVGRPLPGVRLRVVNEQGQPVATGETGGIEVAGPNVFKGYWRMPEKTAEEFSTDGFFKTGDVGRIDAAGYVTIVGRSKDLIISGGYNVYPAEIEGYINELAGVAESAVIGVAHADFGEVGLALVIAKPGWPISRCPSNACLCPNCRVTPWARSRKTCCGPFTAQSEVGSALAQHQHRDLGVCQHLLRFAAQ
jgi:malonyl-CoA/methylmalonyl-CoA synthetase